MSLELADLPAIKCPCIRPTGSQLTRYQETPLYPEGLYDLGSEIYAWMVPNGSWGESNSGLVMLEDQSLLIDTLWDHNHTQNMLDAMAEFTNERPIKTLINTHADGDHFWGNYLLKDIEIITSEAALKDMSHHVPKQMLLFNNIGKLFSCMPMKKTRQVGHWFQGMGKPYAFNKVKHTKANRSFNKELTLEFNSRKVELIEVGPAHRPGDVIVYIPDTKILFSSDLLFIGSTPVMWSGPLENWIKALDLMLEMDIEKIVPGHGPITNKEGVKRVKQYWLFLHDQATQKFKNNKSPKKAAEEIIFSEEFAKTGFLDWDSPERIMTNCHVLYRHEKGINKPIKPVEIINILSKQALLANKLPGTKPQMMRL